MSALKMDHPEARDDVYGLLGRLCENIYDKNHQVDEHPYLPEANKDRELRRLKSKAYEILLNKSGKDYAKDYKPCDPIIELLKHAFVLKVGKGCISQAAELQKYLDEYIDNGLDPDSVTYSVLQFLNCLKSLESDDDSSLDVFYYDKPHPLLPEMPCNESGIPPFQIYPPESFYLPTKFENMLKQEHSTVIKYNAAEPGSNLTLLGRFTQSTSNIQNITRHNCDFDSMSSIPRRTTNFLNGSNLTLSSYFVPQIKDFEESGDQFSACKEGIVTEPESPWQCQDPLECFNQNGLGSCHNQIEICETIENEQIEEKLNLDEIWEQVVDDIPLSNHRTWETFGSSEPPKEPPFVSECVKATIHLVNVANHTILPNRDTILHPPEEVSCKEFISNVKLLLLGVESSTFIYKSSHGFKLKKNVSLHDMNSNTLKNLCYEISHWGTCFKNLSNLIVPDPQTGKLQIEGLIFKALCSSIKEFLLFYHAAILKVQTHENEGLLKFFKKIRPLGNIIHKVAELCRLDIQGSTSLGQGIGILTHIYKEVTKVTEQNIALIFYSILKDCCEVYFRFLQQWIFEGVCVDIYEEFMIQIRPQYLRMRSHRFWTRGFIVNKKSVPGFLSELTESILQCGKAVALLKICDPQNPLCRVSISSQPPVRVCLSVGMLREQAKFYDEYMIRGEIAQGEVASLYSAIQAEKDAEKKRAELVIAAQQDTLLRLKKERELALLKRAKEKNELLELLKDQVEEVAQRKERDRDAELLADKLYLESVMRHEEEVKNLERIERENTIKYYNELAEEAQKRRIHAEWRIRRMNLFDERVLAIANMRREFVNTPDDFKTPVGVVVHEKKQEPGEGETAPMVVASGTEESEKKEDVAEKQENANIENFVVPKIASDEADETEEVLSEDENSNPTSVKSEVVPSNNQKLNILDEQNQNLTTENRQNQNTEQPSTKAVRPTVLDITDVSTPNFTRNSDKLDGLQNSQKPNVEITALDLLDMRTAKLSEAQRNKLKVLQSEYGNATRNVNEKPTLNLLSLTGTDNLTDAQRNRLKVLQSEFGITPNNNESTTIMRAIENSQEPGELTDIQANRFRNTQHLTHLNWDGLAPNDNMCKTNTNEEKTEIDLNRLRNTQHLTHLNWDDQETIDNARKDNANEEKTEIDLNRLRNTQHLTHLNWDDHETIDNARKDNANEEKTEIDLNRLRNTQHLTHLNWDDHETNDNARKDNANEEKTEIELNRLRNTQHLTHLNWNLVENNDDDDVRNGAEKQLTDAQVECQKNRNRNMTHNTDQFDFDINRFSYHEHLKETPMSTTTDYFTVSTHSDSMPVQSCENTPFSEITNHSDMLFARSSDGLSSDEVSQSRCCSKYFQDTPSFPNFIGFGSMANTPSAESSQQQQQLQQQQQQLTIADIEMIDTTSLQVFLKRSVVIPLTTQKRLINNAIIKYLLNECKMLSHLHSLRSYFFLLNGEFAKTLSQSLFRRLYEAQTPMELFNSSTLSNFLEKALVCSLSTTYANSELLSLSATEVPRHLQTSNPEILSCLSLNYKISWPLNIIFNNIVMQQYSRVFKFLLMVGRVLWVLQEDFQILKIARKVSVTNNHHKLQLYRHSMMQFMNALHTYLTCSVLHASWSEFEKKLENSTTLDEVYETHVSYIKKILSRCMLNVSGEKMRTCLCNIFKVVLKFHNRVRVQNWSAADVSGPNYDNLEKMYVAFCEQRDYLVHVAEKLAISGYQPHLMQFLHALNINHRYDLTSRK